MAKVRRSKIKAGIVEDLVVHPALKEYFSYRFYKIAMRLRAELNEALEQYGMISTHLGILRVLYKEGPASQADLGRGMGIDKASMVKFLDEMEKRGFIRRIAVKGDRRVKRISITPNGSAKLRAGTKKRSEVEKRFFSPLGRNELIALDRTLGKLICL